MSESRALVFDFPLDCNAGVDWKKVDIPHARSSLGMTAGKMCKNPLPALADFLSLLC
jgi:hypothetical protein